MNDLIFMVQHKAQQALLAKSYILHVNSNLYYFIFPYVGKALLAKDCHAFNITDNWLERTCYGDCQIFFSKKRRAVTLRATASSSEAVNRYVFFSLESEVIFAFLS